MIRKYPDVNWPDEDLIRHCLDGDQGAWSALVQKYRKLVYSVPVKYQLPPEEAADVFQGVWIDLHRDLSRLEKVAGLRSWLVTAAARRSLLHKKRRQSLLRSAEPDPQFPDATPGVERLIEEAEREQMLRDAVKQLPRRCQRMVEMLFFQQPPRPYADIARELGLAEGSIGFIRSRCLEKLRKLLEPGGRD